MNALHNLMMEFSTPSFPPEINHAFELMLKDDIRSVLVAVIMVAAFQIMTSVFLLIALVRKIFKLSERTSEAIKQSTIDTINSFHAVSIQRAESVKELKEAISEALETALTKISATDAKLDIVLREIIEILNSAYKATLESLKNKQS